MAAKSQGTCYPSQGLVTQDHTQQPVCTHCNAANPYSNASCNNSTNYASCSSYCVSSCNTVCNTTQAYCSIGHELIQSHADVSTHPPIACTVRDELIFRNWTASYWNSLIDKLDTAEVMGKTQTHGAGPNATYAAPDPCNQITHPANSLVTAEKYNQVATKINRFHRSIATVNVGDVIRGLHAAALVSDYNAATFNTNVCDVCNTSGQTNPTCNCNCPCACGCSCTCSCSCGSGG